MRSAAAAFAWEFRQQHRWALVAGATYITLVVGYRFLFAEASAMVRLDPPDPLAGLIITPLSITFLYLLAVFSFGLSGDLAAVHEETTIGAFEQETIVAPARDVKFNSAGKACDDVEVV